MSVKSLFGVARIVAVTFALIGGFAFAQAQGKWDSNARAFFDRLNAEGVSEPQGFDSRKFFEKLSAEASSDKKMDTRTFFDKLNAEGVKMPAGFDGKKFFEKLNAEGSSNMIPPMVDPKK